MRTGRSYVATAFALGIISVSGCAAESASDEGSFPSNKDWGDENKYPEIGGAYASLSALTGTCAFDTASSTLTVTSTAAQTIQIGKRAVDSAVLVNGKTCGTPVVIATAMKKLAVVGSANDEVVILDFLGGVYAPGVASATAGGIDINLSTGTDELRVRGTSGADTFTVGSDGISFNTDNFKDITYAAGIDKFTFALAGGADIFNATNTAAVVTKGVTGGTTVPVTVFGGDGNDVLTGGAGSDLVYGGPGADTLSGGGVAASADTDYLYGEAGADILAQDAANNGPDFVYCGTEAVPDPAKPVVDVVSYALRGNATVRDSTSAATVATSDAARVWVTVGNNEAVDSTGPGGNVDGYKEYDADDGYLVPAGDLTSPLVAFDPTSDVTVEGDSVAADCEQVIGGLDNDILTGDANANTLSGGIGDDLLSGLAGADVLNGDAGDDTFSEGAATNGGDVFNGGAGTDTVDYSLRVAALTVTMDGAAADDGLSAEADNVQKDVENLLGGTGNDTITGNSLANTLTGGDGNDVLNGLAGEDVFLEGTAANGGDVFNGGADIDLVDYSGRTNGVTVTMDGVAANDGEAADHDNVSADIENLNGTAADDTITGNALDNTIDGEGAATNDVILCGLGADVAYLNATDVRDPSCEL